MMHESYIKWLNNGCAKVYCECSKHEEIIITKNHKYNGIPRYIRGHQLHGVNHPMYGKHQSIESRIKIGEGNKNKIISEEVRKKISKGMIGINKDKKQSPERIMKQSIALKKYYDSGGINYTKGIPRPNIRGENNPVFINIDKCKCGKGNYYNSPLQGKIWLRSSYELAYAKYLDSINEPWMYEMQTFDLGDTTYTPDFFLPRLELFIEVKGYMRPEAQDKINKFLEQYPWDLEILFKDDLIELGVF